MVVVPLMFRPGAVYYDEWHQAKGEGTKTIRTLSELCDVDDDAPRVWRPLVTLLSGTPMTTGPSDFKGVFPLIKCKSTQPRSECDSLAGAERLFKELDRARVSKSDDVPHRKEAFRARLKGIISPVFVYRDYSNSVP